MNRRRISQTLITAAACAALGFPGASQPVAPASSSSALNWTRLAPATHPAARAGGSMAYDAAPGTVVLFAGSAQHRSFLHDTWTLG
jgi:hypothetical protein